MPKEEEQEFIREFECKGEWWFPKNKGKKVCGILRFNVESGGKLEVVGRRITIWNASSLWLKPVTLFGSSDKGDITLFDCSLSSSSASLSKLSTASFKFSEGVIGKHILKKEELVIQRVAVNYSYLNAWSDSFGIDPGETLISFVREKEELFFKLPQPFLLAKGNGYEIYLKARSKKSFSLTDTSKQIMLEEIPYIEVLLKKGKNTLKDYQEFVKSMQYFLSLAVREQVFPLVFTGATSGRKPLIFFYRLSSIPVSETLLVANFALSNIKESINEYMKKWIDEREILEPACELFFSSLNRNLSPELRFSYLIQAVEGLHRAVYENGKYITDEEYRKEGGLYETFVGVIPDSISSDFKQSLVSGKLYYANEYALRKRLKGMLSDNYLEIINIRKTIVKKEERNGLIDKIVDTRNYYAHQDEELKDKILKGEELERAIEVLKALTEIVLISEMGISVEEIKELRRTLHPL
jgi:hypothetical protein